MLIGDKMKMKTFCLMTTADRLEISLLINTSLILVNIIAVFKIVGTATPCELFEQFTATILN